MHCCRLSIHENGLNNKDITLDITGDEAEAVNREKKVMKWDRKRKRFVKASLGVDVNNKKMMKNEAGKLVKKEEQGKL